MLSSVSNLYGEAVFVFIIFLLRCLTVFPADVCDGSPIYIRVIYHVASREAITGSLMVIYLASTSCQYGQTPWLAFVVPVYYVPRGCHETI